MTEQAATLRRITAHFSGTVQGVGFRYATQGVAAHFAVTGFVRNMPDGRVELVAEGQAEEIRSFIAAIQAEMGHCISNIEENTGTADGRFKSFEIRF